MSLRCGLRSTRGCSRPYSQASHGIPVKSGDNREVVDSVVQALIRMRIQPLVDSGAKSLRTSVGDLPLSPLMDPAYIAAKRKYAAPKPRVDYSKHGKLEKRLAKNPYANSAMRVAWALAGPARMDAVTGAILPRFFLQDFGYVQHPETNAPWYMPTSLMTQENTVPEIQGEEPTHGPSRQNPRGVPRPHAKGSYTLCRRDVLAALAEPKSASKKSKPGPYSGATKRMAALAGQDPGSAVFRGDMDTFVLDLMRARITDQLLHYARICERPENPRKYLVRCEGDDWTSVDAARAHCGCVLWLGGGATGKRPPGDFETVRLGGAKVENPAPVHNLEHLLGPGNLRKLREGSRLFAEGSVFILGRQKSTRLQLRLWKIQGYLASYKEVARNGQGV